MKKHFKSVFISDLHLGSEACNAEKLNEFLSTFTCENLFLVGDIIDILALTKKKSYFPQEHVNVIRKLLTKAKKGTKIFYVIGNHDMAIGKYTDIINTIGNITIADEFIYTTVTGKKLLVSHGHLYDNIVLYHVWVAHLGDFLYDKIVSLSGAIDKIRKLFNMEYWSLAAFLKTKVKHVLEFIYAFESAVIREAKKRGLDGAVCGHIHFLNAKIVDGLDYYNCGDFCYSYSAIVEYHDGTIEMIKHPLSEIKK